MCVCVCEEEGRDEGMNGEKDDRKKGGREGEGR
jgi:hypothetical protein